MTHADEGPLPCFGTLDQGAGLQEVSVIRAIEEYLAYHQLAEPLQVFRREVEGAELRKKPSAASQQAAQDEEVLGHFDLGAREAFSAAWQRVVPCERQSCPEGRALQLKLQAHFAIFRAREALQEGREPSAAELQDLEAFRGFLSERGQDEVSGQESLMPLFALPFVQRPHAHPDMSEVFSGRWLETLRSEVQAMLRSARDPIPLVYDLLQPSERSSWQAVWAELVRLSDAGLDAISLLSQGVAVAPHALAEARQQLELLRESVPGGLELQLGSREAVDRHGPMSPARSVRSRAATARPARPRLPPIDFAALRGFVCDTQVRENTAAVLRAVLQRLTSAETQLAERRGFLVAIPCFDVLGVAGAADALPRLLEGPEVDLTLGILAALACEAMGRSYIASSDASVERMVTLLKCKPLDSSVHIQALAAMQRLSLRRRAQDRMIEMGLVEWVVSVLGSPMEGLGAPSEFSLEFGSAMLMNLALRSAGKRKCLEQDMLPVALKLMEHWNPQIRTHINGTLYSLLSVPSFRENAKASGLEATLRSIHAQASGVGDEISVRQIEYLLEQLNPEAPPSDGESGEDDEDDDENFLEEEELAGLLLGDRSDHSAEEALRPFAASAAVLEAQQREFQRLVGNA
ncbi:unnamed protein product [Effrenium voratum]|nr:unnamed protein product [Effrenium voratum]